FIGSTGWNNDHTLRVIKVGDHVEITESDVPDGAVIAMTERETLIDSRELKYMAVAMLSWLGFCGMPDEHEDDPLARIIGYMVDVGSELQKGKERARGREGPPASEK